MKNLSIILTALSAGSAPLLPQTAPEPVQIVKPAYAAERSGREAVAMIRQTYEKDGYAEFFKELDDSYTALKENGRMDEFAEMRIGYSPEWEEWESRAAALQNEKKQDLLFAVQDQKMSPFVEKVRSVSANLSDESHENAIVQMANLRAEAPGTGKNSDENRLIDLDLEYEYKSLHIDLPGLSAADRREKQCALMMEKLGKMLAASSEFKDAALKKTVALYADNFDARLAQSWDIADLNALTNGKRKPADALEEKVASILTVYQEKFSDLSRQFFAEHEKN
jgi:hypothetical protein